MESTATESKSGVPRGVVLTAVVLGLAAVAVALFVESPPASVLGKADLVGFAICHRIAERSFFLGGRQLPLCARCTGTFLGAMLGLGAVTAFRRGRASQLPPLPILGLLVLFMGVWAFDGLNSYLGFFPGAPQLYEPRNWLRLTTGMGNGLALILFVLPIFNFTVWREPRAEPVVKRAWEVGALLAVAAALVVIVQAEIDWLLYPIAIISSLGVVVLLTMVNSMLAAVLMRREGHARHWYQVAVPVLVGLGLVAVEVTAMGLLRAYLTVTFGLTF